MRYCKYLVHVTLKIVLVSQSSNFHQGFYTNHGAYRMFSICVIQAITYVLGIIDDVVHEGN